MSKQIIGLASRALAAKTLAEAVPQVLETFKREGLDPFSATQVLEALKARFPKACVDKGLIMTLIKGSASQNKKGGWFWSQTKKPFWEEEIVEETIAFSPPIETEASLMPENNSWLSLNNANQGPFAQDAYLRFVAQAQTPCFGKFGIGDATCASCSLAPNCLSAFLVQAALKGAALDAAPITKVQPEKAANNPITGQKSVQELIAALNAKGISAKPIKDLTFKGSCMACKQELPIGAAPIGITGKGMYHLACAEKILNESQ